MMSDTTILQNDFYRGKRFFRLLNENWLPTSRWKTMKHFYRAMPFPASEGDFPATLSTFQKKIYTVRAPTLVLWGMADPYFTPHLLDGMDALVPNLEVVRYPEATHWIHHEIDDLNEQILRFLARLPARD
jgi:pimeloyl-ACP methyl ester carboxylesterase